MSEKWPTVKLTPQQQRKWDETRTAMLWAVPALSDVWYNLMVDDAGETAHFTDKVDVAGTNGKTLFLNPASYFEKYNLDERIFINGQEILHNIFDHPGLFAALARAGTITYPDGTTLPYDDNTMQRSADMVLNAILVDSKIGSKPADACYDPSQVNGDMSVVNAYRVVYEDQQKHGGSKKPKQQPGQSPEQGQGPGQPDPNGQGKPPPGSFDNHLSPGEGDGKDEATAAGERNEAAWKTGVDAAMQSARLQGKLPAGLERLLGKVIDPDMPWDDKLRSAISRRLGNSSSSWSELDHNLIHRGIGAPGRLAFGAGTVFVVWDTSGSMTQSDMDIVASKTSGIIDDVRPKRLVVMQCDAAIKEVFECDDTDDLMRRKLKGGGGTDFRPPFNHIEKEGEPVDMLIYFTDMQGSFPDKPPSYPVIWCSLIKGLKAPWGDYIDVPIKAAK